MSIVKQHTYNVLTKFLVGDRPTVITPCIWGFTKQLVIKKCSHLVLVRECFTVALGLLLRPHFSTYPTEGARTGGAA